MTAMAGASRPVLGLGAHCAADRPPVVAALDGWVDGPEPLATSRDSYELPRSSEWPTTGGFSGCFLWRRSWQIFPCVRCLRGALGGSINSGFNHPGFRDLLRASSFGGSLICESGPPPLVACGLVEESSWLIGVLGVFRTVGEMIVR